MNGRVLNDAGVQRVYASDNIHVQPEEDPAPSVFGGAQETQVVQTASFMGQAVNIDDLIARQPSILNKKSPEALFDEEEMQAFSAGYETSVKTAQKLDEFVYLPEIPLSYELQKFTYEQCMLRDLEYELMLAIMWRESGFQTNAVNHNYNGTCDNGVMQINDVNRGWLYEQHGIDNLLDPYQNIEAGTIIFSMFFDKYETNQALMAYQYGESGMLRKANQGITTNSLVDKAVTQRDYYKELMASA